MIRSLGLVGGYLLSRMHPPADSSGGPEKDCHPGKALQKFMSCGNRFYDSAVRVFRNHATVSLTSICPEVDAYDQCAHDTQQEARCSSGYEVAPHIKFIADGVTQRYHLLCSALKKAAFQKSTTACNRQRFINDMFLCGFHFANIMDIARKDSGINPCTSLGCGEELRRVQVYRTVLPLRQSFHEYDERQPPGHRSHLQGGAQVPAMHRQSPTGQPLPGYGGAERPPGLHGAAYAGESRVPVLRQGKRGVRGERKREREPLGWRPLGHCCYLPTVSPSRKKEAHCSHCLLLARHKFFAALKQRRLCSKRKTVVQLLSMLQ
ncbi:uncharacterized protein LOC142592747 isoform X3 [Dermacentor variabilis]|uniref:uncharacterized protein LOC142592747 isoform X3 n=1 Tax=Dermacentor variabilis TaxID=34621 RepID=UPI003F5C2EFC